VQSAHRVRLVDDQRNRYAPAWLVCGPVLHINKAWPKATGRWLRSGGMSGRAGALGPAQPSPICREQFAREVRAVIIAEDIADFAYRALIRLARIRTSGENARIRVTQPG
jgi:hypothetical protein